MVVKRRRKTSSRRKKSHYKRGRWAKYFYGGYMDDGNGFKVARDLSHISDQKEEFQKNYEKNKPSKFWLPSFLDHRANKNVIDDYTMNAIESKMLSGDPTTRQVAREQLKDMLLVRDIQTNPDDYMREWEAGKHKRNNWVKTATRVGLGTAAALGTGFLLYNWGTPMLGLAANGLSHLKDWWRGAPTTQPVNLQSVADFSIKNSIVPSSGNEIEDSIWGKVFEGIKKAGDFKINSQGNAGILGFDKKAGKFLLEGTDKMQHWVKPEGLLSFAAQNPANFMGIIKQMGKYGGEQLILEEAIKNFGGSGFRVTRRGRRLLRRYRRHLRHRRRH